MATIASRLKKLEQTSTESTLPSEVRCLLVSILARRDALFFPWRSWGDHRIAIAERQRKYLAGETGIAAKADGRTQWKEAHGLRLALIQAGFVVANYSKGQIIDVFLTSLGETTARKLVGTRLHSVELALPFLERVRSLPGHTFLGRSWVSESELAGFELVGDPSDWSELTEFALPLLCCGMLVASCDTHGRVYYRATDEPQPGVVDVAVDCDPSMDAFYLEAYHAERTTLSNAIPSDCSEIQIPIPGSW